MKMPGNPLWKSQSRGVSHRCRVRQRCPVLRQGADDGVGYDGVHQISNQLFLADIKQLISIKIKIELSKKLYSRLPCSSKNQKNLHTMHCMWPWSLKEWVIMLHLFPREVHTQSSIITTSALQLICLHIHSDINALLSTTTYPIS